MLVSFVAVDLLAGAVLLRTHGPMILPDARRHHRLAPSQATTVQDVDFTYTLQTNSRGLRAREVVVPKPAGVVRIAFLGDSFTMGKGVDDDQTFASVVEATLGRRHPDVRYEVLNAGVDSYAPVLSRLQLEELLDLQLDQVVHALDMGDLLQEQAYRRLAELGPDGSIKAVPSSGASLEPTARVAPADQPGWSQSLASWAMRHMFFTGIAIVGLRDNSALTVDNFVRLANPELLRHTLEDDPIDRTDQWKALFDSIRQIAETCSEHGIRYSLVIYPWGHQVDDRQWRTGRRLFVAPGAVASDAVRAVVAAHAKALGIPLWDTFDAFRGYRGSQPLYFEHDMHWTPAGHAVMAEELVHRFDDQRLSADDVRGATRRR